MPRTLLSLDFADLVPKLVAEFWPAVRDDVEGAAENAVSAYYCLQCCPAQPRARARPSQCLRGGGPNLLRFRCVPGRGNFRCTNFLQNPKLWIDDVICFVFGLCRGSGVPNSHKLGRGHGIVAFVTVIVTCDIAAARGSTCALLAMSPQLIAIDSYSPFA